MCAGAPPWHEVVAAHDGRPPRDRRGRGAVPRIERAYDALAAELALFVVGLRPHWSLARMASHHERLLRALERDGPDALRRHLIEGRDSVLERLPA